MKIQKYEQLEYRDFNACNSILIAFYLNNKTLYTKGFNFKFYRSLDMFMGKDFIIFEIFKII